MSATTVAFIPPEADTGAAPINAVRTVTGKHNPRSFTSPDGVNYELVYVTPDLAQRWLHRNNGNRPLRGEVVARLARDLQAGRFMENGDAIRVSADGDLADGQHRLNAIAESGVGVWMLVVSNLPAEARATVDDGVKRTMGDRLGFRGEGSPKTLAAVVRRALLWDRRAYTNATYQPSTLESFEFLDQNPDLRQAASAADHYRKARMLSGSTIGLCWWLFARLDADQCKEFFDRLQDGAMLASGHPVLTLRNRLNALNAQPGRVPFSHTTALAIKAWNYYRDGAELRTIRHAEHEKFPTPK
ncbi:hypothetical protein ACIBQ1_09615 [Nonomuraea sp. NPDC050153]|uniref:hypothetical protein n=1 Tax=Nonomuraea sp. NPDC050153 TaxID=3364359 RepID=UPI0037BCD26B